MISNPETLFYRLATPVQPDTSDEHLHAMAQFIVSYSAVEWQLSDLFAFFLKMPVSEAQRL